MFANGSTAAGANAVGVELTTAEPEADLAALVERCLGDVALAARLLGRFGDRLPGAVAKIESCLLAANRREAGALAHSLKGEAGSLSAKKLYRTAAALEQYLKSAADYSQNEADRLARVLRLAADQMRDSLPRLLEALKAFSSSAN